MKIKNMLLMMAIGLQISLLYGQATGNYNSQYNKNGRQNPIANNNSNPQQNRAVISSENIFTIDINALSNEKAIGFIAIFALSQAGENAEETDRLWNEKYQRFLKNIESLNISKQDIYVDMVSFVPKYEYITDKKIFSRKTYIETPKGFLLQKNVHIRYNEESILDKLVTAAANADVYDLVKVEYQTVSPATVYNKLRMETFKYLNEQIEMYQRAGIKLDSAYRSMAENTWITMPHNRYSKYQAFSSFSTLKDYSQMGKVNTQDYEKVMTEFYEPLSPIDYDIVLNPNVFKPVIQFSMNLQVRFVLKERQPIIFEKAIRETQVILPNGGVHTVKH